MLRANGCVCTQPPQQQQQQQKQQQQHQRQHCLGSSLPWPYARDGKVDHYLRSRTGGVACRAGQLNGALVIRLFPDSRASRRKDNHDNEPLSGKREEPDLERMHVQTRRPSAGKGNSSTGTFRQLFVSEWGAL